MVQNYALSSAGVTTYADVPELPSGYREGRPDVSELFERQLLQASAAPGLCPPSGPMLSHLEARHRYRPSPAALRVAAFRPPS